MRDFLDEKAGWLLPSLLLCFILMSSGIILSFFTDASAQISFEFLAAGTRAAVALGGGWAVFEAYRRWRERRGEVLSCLQQRFDLGRIGTFFAGAILAMFCIYNYGGVKSQLALLLPFSADPWLADFDWMLMGGTDAWERLSWARHDLMFKLYHVGWTAWLMLSVAFQLIRQPSKQGDILITTFFALWVAGPLIHLIMPAAGPIFYDNIGLGDRFAAMPLLAESRFVEAYLWEGYVNREIIPVGGISAMPSLHMATAAWAIMVFWRTTIRWLAIAIFCYLQVGSVLTGWHYVADGVIGTAMAMACHAVVKVVFFGPKTTPVILDADAIIVRSTKPAA